MSSKQAFDQEISPLVDMLEERCEKLGFELLGYVLVDSANDDDDEVDIYTFQVSDVQLDAERIQQIVEQIEKLKAELAEINPPDVSDIRPFKEDAMGEKKPKGHDLERKDAELVETGERIQIHRYVDGDDTYVIVRRDSEGIPYKEQGVTRDQFRVDD